MDQLDIAIHETALNAKGGIAAIARAMGKGHQVMINKCNPNTDNSVLSLREAVAMMEITGDYRILEVIADQLGYNLVRKNLPNATSIVDAVLNADAEHGDVSRKIRDAISDGTLTMKERDDIARKISEAKAALDEVHAAIQQAPTRLYKA